MQAIILALLESLTPMVLKGIRDWQARTGRTDLPTVEDLRATYNANWQAALTEGTDWQAAHPKPTP